MRIADGRLRASPTDLANFIACRHKTELDELVAHGRLVAPHWQDPLAEILRARGDLHEARHVDNLAAQGLTVVDLRNVERDERPAETLGAMRAGADVIVQAALVTGQWLGYADILRKVPRASPHLGDWSYEAHDTKLSRETRGGTILQLCVYSELIAEIQGLPPEHFHVVTPAGAESYRVDDFGAFYRQVRARFWEAVTAGTRHVEPVTYPEPVDHCQVCRWSSRCNGRRRADDHLSFVAGIGRQQRSELVAHGISRLEALATTPLPLPFKPSRGTVETYEKLRAQARLQFEQRESGRPTFEYLPAQPGFGLCQLPEPRPGDLFLDLEGDPFGRPEGGTQPGEGGREYLFGLGRVAADGSFAYQPRWAFTDAEERAAFEAVINDIMAALAADPAIHVYHYAPYEPSAFKRLMGRYASREADVDRLLRGKRFVDLFAIVRQAVRAGVERYSIKDLEPFYGFQRDVELDEAGDRRRVVEIALESSDLTAVTPAIRAIVEGYNQDDCRSVLDLRGWLEERRRERLAAGEDIPRPPLEPDEPSENVTERKERVAALRARLLDGLPADRQTWTDETNARYLLSYTLDWHDREDKVTWWEYFRLRDLTDDELLEEPKAIGALSFEGRVGEKLNRRTGRPTGSVIDRYRFPPQDCEIRAGMELKTRDGKKFAKVISVDRMKLTIDIEKGPNVVDVHPASVFAHKYISPEASEKALFALGEQVADGGFAAAPKVAGDLLLRRTPTVGGASLSPGSASVADYAVQIAGALTDVALAIQGPPGSGKTYTGARMICELARAGKRIGVTATSHKVIDNLLAAVAVEARHHNQPIRLGRRDGEDGEGAKGGIQIFEDNPSARAALAGHTVDVMGGTAWLWARPEFRDSVDVLFIDEAGQMSLANALAVSHASPALVLLGDPQQLEQPQKGSHPDGVDVSALDHVLGHHKTMPADRGLFLPVTWRLAPSICWFTSEMFYEGKLTSLAGLEHQVLVGAGQWSGHGLCVVGVAHDACRNASDEEANVVVSIVQQVLRPGSAWIDRKRARRRLTTEDILVVAPYNAHVARLQERLAAAGIADVRVGTVDKFQGQEAPVVIYSMATSRPEDAPRGMEFLYSLNRLNVATSRARCACILVANPRLFEPDCRTPRQMQLANALARYREVAKPLPEMQ